MATNAEFKDFVLDCLAAAASAADLAVHFESRKMFGEYCIYALDGETRKVPFLLCGQQVFAPKMDELNGFVSQFAWCFDVGLPFKAAKEHFVILDIENADFLGEFLERLLPLLPPVKPKKRKGKSEKK